MGYILGSSIKFLIFIVVLPLTGWSVYRIVQKKRGNASVADPAVIFPTILITAVLVKIVHVLIKHLY